MGTTETEATNPTRRRIATYWAVGILFALGYASLRDSTWQGNAQLHTFMEGLATLLALMVGVMALVRFYSKKNNTFLFLGVAFLGTGFLDGYHALVTSQYFKVYLPSDLPSLIPWSWVASRMFLALLMYLSYLAWTRENRLGEAGRIDERAVYLFAGALTMASFLFFTFAPLPRAYYPEIWFHRPEEFVPALFFLLALVGYLRKGAWQHDAFEHWLVLSLIVGLVGQAVFMSYSGQLFDFEFDAAHTLKKVSYLCVLTGLLISMYSIFRQAVEGRDSLVQEIEERKQTEDALKDSEERFRAVVNNSPTKIHIKDTSGRYILVNRHAEMLFGVTNEKARGKTSNEIFPPKVAAAFAGHDQAVLETGQAVEQEEEWLDEGGTHTYLTVKFPIRDGIGKIVAIGAIGTDITERKRTEKALRDSEERFQNFAEIGSDWMWEMDADLRFSYLSDPVHRITGLPREHYLGKTRAEVGTGNADDEAWQQHLADLEAHRPFRDFCYSIDRADGSTHYWTISGTPVFDASGKFEGYRGIGSDITERKAAEKAVCLAMQEAEIASRTKSEFLATMSHELRTPLNAIIGFSEIMKDETLGPIGSTKYRDYADDIHESGQHLLALINDILDLSKVESGTDDLDEENIEISEIANSIMKLAMGLDRAGDVELELIATDDIPLLYADERRVKQILLNLLSNAIKFTPCGGKVTLKIWSRAESGYIFQVTDTGIGIAFEDIPKALAPFQQIDSGLNRKHEGTGLGLPLTKLLVEMHGGYLDLQSKVGVGTTVTVRFPAERIVPSPRDTKAVGTVHEKAG